MNYKYYILWFDIWCPGAWCYHTTKRYCDTPKEALETYRYEKARGSFGFTVERVA